MAEPALYVVATPIGNLSDISPRALDVLSTVDLVAAEDTRVTRRLLDHHGIRTTLTAVHEHNERQVAEELAGRIATGASIALVSDAGTPLLSDPGYRLVVAAHRAGVPVIAVAGPSAVTAALSVAGLPTDRFVFEGFLPARAEARATRLRQLADEARTLVLFESAQRLVQTLADAAAVFGEERPAALCRELTKRFETVRRATLGELRAWVEGDSDQRRGECVLVIGGHPAPPGERLAEAERLARTLSEHLSASQAARVAAGHYGVARRAVYEALQEGDA